MHSHGVIGEVGAHKLQGAELLALDERPDGAHHIGVITVVIDDNLRRQSIEHSTRRYDTV